MGRPSVSGPATPPRSPDAGPGCSQWFINRDFGAPRRGGRVRAERLVADESRSPAPQSPPRLRGGAVDNSRSQGPTPEGSGLVKRLAVPASVPTGGQLGRLTSARLMPGHPSRRQTPHGVQSAARQDPSTPPKGGPGVAGSWVRWLSHGKAVPSRPAERPVVKEPVGHTNRCLQFPDALFFLNRGAAPPTARARGSPRLGAHPYKSRHSIGQPALVRGQIGVPPRLL
jgi:hypothetical protein